MPVLDPLEDQNREKLLSSRNGFHEDPIEDIAFALAYELEIAELNPGDLVTVNREKLRAIATRVMDKALTILRQEAEK